jgi:hypothetical protein
MTPGTPGDDDDDDDADDDDDTLSGGEASLGTIDVMGSPDNEDVEEGEEDVAVFGFEIEVEDGDVMFERVDVQFDAASSTLEDEPWELLDEVSLWLGDEEVGRIDASDEDEWDEVSSDVYEVRFVGLEEVVNEDDTAEFYVAVSAAGNIDTADLDQEFDVSIPEDGVRAVDGEGINHYEPGSESDATTFGFEVEGANEELDVSLSSNNPYEAVIMVEEDSTSDAYELLVFELEAEGNDIEINEIPILMTFGTTDEFDQVVADAWLEVDGEVFNDFDETPSSGTSTTFTLAFDIDGDIVIEEDDTVEVSFVAEFQETDGNYSNGLTVSADVTVDDIDAEGADELDNSQTNGSANGDDFTLMAEGLFAEANPDDHEATRSSTDTDDAFEVGNFTLEFSVTAFEEDFYMPMTVGRNTIASTTQGFVYTIQSGGASVSTGTSTDDITSTADDDGTYFVVREGDTEEFTIEISYDPASAGFYRAALTGIQYDADSADSTPDEDYTPSPEDDFETDTVELVAS